MRECERKRESKSESEKRKIASDMISKLYASWMETDRQTELANFSPRVIKEMLPFCRVVATM